MTVRILIVDDTRSDQYLAQHFFRRHLPNAVCEVASDGTEALEVLSRSEEPFDFVLLDINMPRMNGLEFLEEWARVGHTHPPVFVMLTSSEQSSDREATSRYDFVVDYLVKPLRLEDLKRLPVPT